MKTQNLDEAVYLTIKGFKTKKVRVIADRHSEWTFEDCNGVVKASSDFWTGSPVISLNKWMVVRQALKNQQKTLLAEKKPKKVVVSDMRYSVATPYWYIDTFGKVQHATYGKNAVHNKRIDAGNFYKNRSQAVQAQTKV